MKTDNNIPKGWKKVKLGEIAKRITSGGTPSTQKIEYYMDGHIPWLNTKEIKNCRIYQTEKHITEAGLNNSSAKWIEENSVIIAMYGATAGKVAINKIPLTTNQACCNITLDNKKADYNFIYYAIRNSFEKLSLMTSGAAQQNLNVRLISNLEITLPEDIQEQRSIAEILSSLDDKIDLLHRQNETLEAMAQTLFRKWFVEPCKNELPEGWEETILKDIYIFEKGFEPGSKNYLPSQELNTIRFIRVGDLLNTKGNTFIKKELAKIVCKETDLLMSFDGTIGRINFGLNGAFSSGIRRIYSTNELYNGLGLKYLIFSSKDIQDLVKSHASGTVIQHASSSIKYLTFPFPQNKDYIREFSNIVAPMFDKILNNKKQINTLERLRDTLLPKLINGEIRVMNFEL